jgi:integrase
VKEYKATLTPAKGKWYVCMTVPEEVRHLLNSQIKLSTGTSDKNEAQKRLPELAIKLKQKITDAKATLETGELKKEVKLIAANLNRSKEYDIENASTSQLIKILHQLSTSEVLDVFHQGRYQLSNLKRHLSSHSPTVPRLDPQTRKSEVKRIKSLLRQHEPSPTSFKSLADAWANKKQWGRQKSKQAYQSHINKFIELVGDVDVKAIKPVTLYDFAEVMDTKYNASNATIRNYISSVSDVLNYAVRHDLITSNPTKVLDLRSYGKAATKRKPFPDEMLHSLFSQALPNDVRMHLSLMITTGMRLDEAGLLTKSNIKMDNGIQYFDLTEAIVKNKGSARKVPVPDVIKKQLSLYLTVIKGDRLFNYPINADGKSQNAASKKCMRYVRKVTSDPALVVHGLRHTFKDFSRNAGIPKDLHDFITGRPGSDTASSYGEGHSLEVKYEALNKIAHPYLMG